MIAQAEKSSDGTGKKSFDFSKKKVYGCSEVKEMPGYDTTGPRVGP
jgi:hypothetical protein